MFLLGWIFYLAACAYLVLALPGAGEAFATTAADLVSRAQAGSAPAIAFAAAALGFLPLAWLFRGALRFWYALTHELSHTLAATALGGRPGELAVGSSGEGRVTFERAPLVAWLVLLAPYVLNPLYVAPLVASGLRDDARVAGAAVAGLATSFALVSNALQVRAYQSDIRRAGVVRSLLFIAWGNLIAGTLATALVVAGPRAALHALVASVWPDSVFR